MGSCNITQTYQLFCSPSQSKRQYELERKKVTKEEENIYQVNLK